MRLVVLYGSQTGNAQDVAEQIWRESKSYGFTGPVLAMDDFPVQNLTAEHLAIFVIATTGNGDEPDNMRQTWKFLLRRNLPLDSLEHLQFACLGLGDSSYAKYNFAAKKLNKRLKQLGATSILPLGLCDDQHDHGLSAVSLPWMAELWQEISKTIVLQKRANDVECKSIFKWSLKVLETAENFIDLNTLRWDVREDTSCLRLAQNERTTATDHFQDVRLLRFAYSFDCSWNAGDVLQLRPCNSDADVDEFFKLVEEHKLNFSRQTIVQLSNAYDDMILPLLYAQPLTVEFLAKYVWDLSWRPRQRAFELLSLNCEDELEREKLIEFTTAEGLDDLINYINRPRRTILEVLDDFKHATSKLTLPILCELFPIIQTRSFSIASMPTAGTVDLLVAVVKYKTKLSNPRLGLCSNWLKSLPLGTEIMASFKAGTLLLPKNILTPIIMVGPGTGIAPFRSIIQSREQLQKNGTKIGKLVLFFGCRNENKDLHFGTDLKKWQENNLVEVFVAFSRDQEHKIYVQHLIKEQKTLLKTLIIEENATILVSGSSNNMPKAVKEAFSCVLDNDDAYIENMIKTKRYQEETWA